MTYKDYVKNTFGYECKTDLWDMFIVAEQNGDVSNIRERHYTLI